MTTHKQNMRRYFLRKHQLPPDPNPNPSSLYIAKKVQICTVMLPPDPANVHKLTHVGAKCVSVRNASGVLERNDGHAS